MSPSEPSRVLGTGNPDAAQVGTTWWVVMLYIGTVDRYSGCRYSSVGMKSTNSSSALRAVET